MKPEEENIENPFLCHLLEAQADAEQIRGLKRKQMLFDSSPNCGRSRAQGNIERARRTRSNPQPPLPRLK